MTRIVRRKLSELRLLEKNARYMKAPVFNQLVQNLGRDGVLTSVPTIYQDEVLSGNHRVQAAIKAGIEEADCLEIVGQLSEGDKVGYLERERRVAIQLSHNALVGEDDPSLLASLYESLPLEDKLYSGITDDQLKLAEDLDLASLSAGATDFQQIELVFVPEEAEAFQHLIERIGKRTGRAAKVSVLVSSLEDWNRVFDAAIGVKTKLNIHNTAIAMRVMAELALQKLEELAPEPDEGATDAA